MSLKAIKHGRRSRESHLKNLKMVRTLEQQEQRIPYLLNYSDSDDLIIRSSIFFDMVHKVEFAGEIKDFDEIFRRVKNLFKKNSVSKEKYLDILNQTGIEIDDRKQYFLFLNKIVEHGFKKFVHLLHGYPGLESLDIENVINVFYKRLADIHLFICALGRFSADENNITIKIDNNHKLEMNKWDRMNITDENTTKFELQHFGDLSNFNLTSEENFFLFGLRILYPDKDYPHFEKLHDRLTLSFVRYLKSCYGQMYHHRLLELLNRISYLKIIFNFSRSWHKKNYEYSNIIGAYGFFAKLLSANSKDDLLKLFYE